MSQTPSEQNPFHGTGATPDQPAAPRQGEGDATGGVIPYKNAPALVAYYLAIFSLIPCIGFPLGVAAFVLGIVGLKKRKANPAIKGSAHAWIGIILGGFCALVYGALIGISLFGVIMEANR